MQKTLPNALVYELIANDISASMRSGWVRRFSAISKTDLGPANRPYFQNAFALCAAVRKKTRRVNRDRGGGLPAGNCRVRARNANNPVKQMFHLTVSNIGLNV